MLFGHQNNDVTPPSSDPTPPVQVAPALNPLAVDPTTGVSLPVVENTDTGSAPADTSASTSFAGMPLPPPPAPAPVPEPTTAPVATVEPEMVAPSASAVADPMAMPEPPTDLTPEPVTPTEPAPEPIAAPEPVAQPELPPAPAPLPQPEEEPTMPLDDEPVPVDSPTDSSFAMPSPEDLLAMKQQALAELTPLVDKLDQSPEERFRTKMMMIQSTDDQTLLKEAYEAAQQITDEKARAQALLDVINEINYFTTPRHD